MPEVGGAVEVAVGDGFHDVVVEDVGGAFEVGDGAGDFKVTASVALDYLSWRCIYIYLQLNQD